MDKQQVAEMLHAILVTGTAPGFEGFGVDFVEDTGTFTVVAPGGKLFTIVVREGA